MLLIVTGQGPQQGRTLPRYDAGPSLLYCHVGFHQTFRSVGSGPVLAPPPLAVEFLVHFSSKPSVASARARAEAGSPCQHARAAMRTLCLQESVAHRHTCSMLISSLC